MKNHRLSTKFSKKTVNVARKNVCFMNRDSASSGLLPMRVVSIDFMRTQIIKIYIRMSQKFEKKENHLYNLFRQMTIWHTQTEFQLILNNITTWRKRYCLWNEFSNSYVMCYQILMKCATPVNEKLTNRKWKRSASLLPAVVQNRHLPLRQCISEERKNANRKAVFEELSEKDAHHSHILRFSDLLDSLMPYTHFYRSEMCCSSLCDSHSSLGRKPNETGTKPTELVREWRGRSMGGEVFIAV